MQIAELLNSNVPTEVGRESEWAKKLVTQLTKKRFSFTCKIYPDDLWRLQLFQNALFGIFCI